MRSADNHYAPLPQAMSDDDDDETKTPESNHDAVVQGRSLNAVAEENAVPLIAVQVDAKRTMSWPRKICFLISILISCFVVFAFCWLLPCDVGYVPCIDQSPKGARKSSPDWRVDLPSTVYSSGLQLIDADLDGQMDIVFGFHVLPGNGSFSEAIDFSSLESGLMVLRGHDGKKLWQQKYQSSPTDIFCNVLDVDRDGAKDCILIGNFGLFFAVNVLNDNVFWYLHDHANDRRPQEFLRPLTIPDVTDDDVEDLVLTCRFDDDEHSPTPQWYLVLVSGKMGAIWGEPFLLPNCVTVSAPVSVVVAGITYLFVHCIPDEANGLVLMIKLDQLREKVKKNSSLSDDGELSKASLSSNVTKIPVAVHRFAGQGSQLHFLVEDLNGDGIDDILMIGGDGEAALYNVANLTPIWSFQQNGFDILGCVLGPVLEYKYETVLLTLLPQNCSEDCATIIYGLSGINGSEIWRHSNKSIASPVIIPKSKAWENLVAFKAFSKHDEMQKGSDDSASTTSDTTDHSSTTPLSSEDSSSREDENAPIALMTEKLLLLNAQYELQEQTLHQPATLCYALKKHLPECLPAFAFHASSALADFDGDERADLVSITMSVDETSSHKRWNMHVTKTNLAQEADGVSSKDSHVGHFLSFE